ncbi:LysE family translocator [Vibrio breoganii]|uniref:LysE family translocator n=1 Tax=Vibrio breoganii TaxID=553239 RepID=UPI00080E724F|nr:LysE family translocator [Vibrio breoganii]OCH72129.1 threonine transporter RhtB [Vibrio breoganii]PMG40581.1 threonine transporter RhtB [Vibrio breoganii]PMG95942.1 threonine transporter RhtB [Vibrio breoganii]PMJ47977.1 threonine transporter RhtB [Vibrio breoganii]PMK29533.1 threonine transporter RhtB [Vibrio breoganii]
MQINDLYTFIAAMTLLTITPGLDTVLVIRNTSRGGKWDGYATSLGICLGLYLHATWSAIGVAAIISQSPDLFNGIKIVGAAYLIYLGVSGARSLRRGVGALQIDSSEKGVPRYISLREGFLSNVLNPKTAVFYLAFLPQFIDQNGNLWLQSMFLASIHFVIAMMWQCGLASMLDKAKALLANGKTNYRLQMCTCVVLVALGAQLMVSSF